MKLVLLASILVSALGQDYCTTTDGSGNTLDFSPVRDAGTFTGVDSSGNQIAFNMCTISTGTDCSAAGFQALATQSGSFGCAIVSEWTPVITPPQWDPITNGVQLTVQNGDACPDGTNRGIQVQFTCDPTGGVGPTSFSASEPVTCQYEWQFATSAACGGAPAPTPPAPTPPGPTPPAPTPPTPTPAPAPQRCVTTPDFDYSGVGHTIANVGDPGACCDVCFLTKGCNAWSVRKPKGDSFSCTLYNETHAVPASSKTVASGMVAGAPTHYQDPFTHACLPDELNVTVANIKGRWCAAACTSSTPCPLDTPVGVTATPACEIHDPVGSGMHCALTCKSSADCGPTSPPPGMNTSGASVTCDTTFTPGVCTYLA